MGTSLAWNPYLVGAVPAASVLTTAGSGYYTFGTSLGLDRSMLSILSDIRSALVRFSGRISLRDAAPMK